RRGLFVSPRRFPSHPVTLLTSRQPSCCVVFDPKPPTNGGRIEDSVSSRWPPQVVQQQLRADAGRLEDDGQAAAGVRTAAHEVQAVEVFEAVSGAQVQHLSEIMGEVEGCPAVDA